MQTDEAEGPQVQVVGRDEVKLLYTSLAGFSTPFDLVSLFFGLFLVVFGLIGFFNSGSAVSLIASVAISLPIFIGSYLTTRHVYWSLLTLAATELLQIMMAIRFYQSAKFYPAGFLASVSFGFAIFLIIRLVHFYRNRHNRPDNDRHPTSQ